MTHFKNPNPTGNTGRGCLYPIGALVLGLLAWLFYCERYTLVFSISAVLSLIAGCLAWPDRHAHDYNSRKYVALLLLALGVFLVACLIFQNS